MLYNVYTSDKSLLTTVINAHRGKLSFLPFSTAKRLNDCQYYFVAGKIKKEIRYTPPRATREDIAEINKFIRTVTFGVSEKMWP